MKRTKTFVMKFLSVFALGALVLSSCTKDLEDRMDKVEEGLATVIKDVKALQDKLAEVEKTIPTEALAKIEALNQKIATLEANGATDAELATAKGELSSLIATIPNVSYSTAADGSLELVFKTGDNVEKIKFVGGDNAVVIDDTTTPGMTKVTVGGKSFTFPSSIPSSVSGVIIASQIAQQLELEGTTTVVITLNTSDGKQVTVTPTNFIITNAYATKASIYEVTANLTIVSVTPRADAINEFDVVIKGAKVVASGAYRIGIKQTANTVMSAEVLETEVVAFSPISAGKVFASFNLPAGATVIKNQTLGTVVVDNSTTDFATKISFEYYNDFGGVGSNNVTSKLTDAIASCYEITAANATAALTAASFNDVDPIFSVAANHASITTFDAKVAALATNASAKSYTGIAVGAIAEGKLPLDFTLPAYDATKIGKRYFLITLAAKCSVDSKVIRAYGIVEIDMQNNVHRAIADKTVTIPIAKYSVAKAFNYLVATGVLNPDPTKYSIIVKNAEGVDVTTTASTVTGVTVSGDNLLSYDVTLDPKLVAGTYTVIITDTFKTNSNLVITQKVTVANPTAVFDYTAAGNGYTSGVLDSYAATTFDATYTYDFTKAFKAVAFTPAQTAAKVFYRLFDGTTPLDGKTTAADLAALYTSAATPATSVIAAVTEVAGNATSTSTLRIAFNKEYSVKAYILLTDGQVIEQATALKVKYSTLNPITGFATTVGTVNTTREFTLVEGDAITKLDLSYVKDVAKSSFFANITNLFLVVGDTKLLAESVLAINATDGIKYEIEPVIYDAASMTVTGTSAATDSFTFVNFYKADDSAVTGSATEITTAGFYSKYTVKVTNGAATFGSLKKAIVQPIKVTVTDIWGRPTTLKINVTITPKPVVVP